MEPVETERLIIRRMAETDLEDFLSYQTHPDVLRHMPLEPLTAERAARFLSKQAVVEIGDEGGYIAFAVEHKDDGKIIGEVGTFIHPAAQNKGDIGWSFHPDYQGRGYATEAGAVLLAYGFKERRLHRLTSVCDVRNVASYRLMERLGMRREGHLRQSIWMDNAWQDEYLYALLRDEWQQQQQ